MALYNFSALFVAGNSRFALGNVSKISLRMFRSIAPPSWFSSVVSTPGVDCIRLVRTKCCQTLLQSRTLRDHLHFFRI